MVTTHGGIMSASPAEPTSTGFSEALASPKTQIRNSILNQVVIPLLSLWMMLWMFSQ